MDEDAVGLPLGEVAFDLVPVRDVMGQVALGRAAEIQGSAVVFVGSSRKERLDQLPMGIGQIARMGASLGS